MSAIFNPLVIVLIMVAAAIGYVYGWLKHRHTALRFCHNLAVLFTSAISIWGYNFVFRLNLVLSDDSASIKGSAGFQPSWFDALVFIGYFLFMGAALRIGSGTVKQIEIRELRAELQLYRTQCTLLKNNMATINECLSSQKTVPQNTRIFPEELDRLLSKP